MCFIPLFVSPYTHNVVYAKYQGINMSCIIGIHVSIDMCRYEMTHIAILESTRVIEHIHMHEASFTSKKKPCIVYYAHGLHKHVCVCGITMID